MNPDEELFVILLNRRASFDERSRVLNALPAQGFERDINEALLALACSPDEDPRLSALAGRELARRYIRSGDLYDAPLHDFSPAAYFGFDDEVTKLLNNRPPPHGDRA